MWCQLLPATSKGATVREKSHCSRWGLFHTYHLEGLLKAVAGGDKNDHLSFMCIDRDGLLNSIRTQKENYRWYGIVMNFIQGARDSRTPGTNMWWPIYALLSSVLSTFERTINSESAGTMTWELRQMVGGFCFYEYVGGSPSWTHFNYHKRQLGNSTKNTPLSLSNAVTKSGKYSLPTGGWRGHQPPIIHLWVTTLVLLLHVILIVEDCPVPQTQRKSCPTPNRP